MNYKLVNTNKFSHKGTKNYIYNEDDAILIYSIKIQIFYCVRFYGFNLSSVYDE